MPELLENLSSRWNLQHQSEALNPAQCRRGALCGKQPRHCTHLAGHPSHHVAGSGHPFPFWRLFGKDLRSQWLWILFILLYLSILIFTGVQKIGILRTPINAVIFLLLIAHYGCKGMGPPSIGAMTSE